MTNKTDNDVLIYKLRSEGWADAADALQAAQEENKILFSRLNEVAADWQVAQTKLAAICDAIEKQSHGEITVVDMIRNILNTTNAQPAQEQGGDE
jgi:hypothetical protein